MKKIFLVAGILLTVTSITFAQNSNDINDTKSVRPAGAITKKELRAERRAENRNEVSDRTRNKFAVDFHGAKNVRFEKTKDFDEVSFTLGRKKMMAYYDIDNELVGTTQKKTFADLPEHAQTKIHEKYASYTVTDVIKFDDNETNNTDMIMFGTSFEDADNYFVELKNGSKAIVVKVDLAGDVTYFADIK